MSREVSVWFSVAEKFLGFLIFVIGLIMVYVTYTNPPAQTVASHSSIFIALGLVLMAIGIFLILAKGK